MKPAIWIFSLFLLAFFFIPYTPIHAAAPNWHLPALQCDAGTCEVRVSPQGTLYTFYWPTQTLYISKADGSIPTAHIVGELSKLAYSAMDFVPYDDLQTVIFFARLGSAVLLRFDIPTNTTTKINSVLPDGELMACNHYMLWIYLPGQYISRLGIGDQLIICSGSPQETIRGHILDISTLSIIQTIDLGDYIGDYPNPYFAWETMFGGLDGNIYFEANRISGIPQFDNQVTNLPLQTGEISVLFKYNPVTETWSAQSRTRSQYITNMYSTQTWGAKISTIVSADSQGNVYSYMSWGDINKHWHHELSKQTPEMVLIAFASDCRNDPLGVFVGMTADGYAVSRTGDAISDTVISQINDYPLPTLTIPATSTN